MKPLDPSHRDEDLDETAALSGAEPEDPRLLEAVREYMNALDAGLRPSRREWLERYPEIAKELGACLDGLAFVHSAAGKMNPETLDVPEGALARPLGDFRLIKEIGRGGMGVVYEAIQLSLGRKVAVKVLPFTAALDPRHLERFRNEASAAAHLHHTNIVPVYAVGCERSVHYYAMQLIEGQSLAQVIRELRNLVENLPGLRGNSAATARIALQPSAASSASSAEEVPSSAMYSGVSAMKGAEVTGASLSTLRSSKPLAFYQSVARLGQQAAEALQYAHEAGVVHRDIKPANLMVDGRGKLWITDFGLAQFYADAELTQTGDLVGTIAYMSPEQASGKAVVLDQRTDIYSLGITLYELLTQRRAFSAKNREELLRQVSTMEPRSPRSIDKRIPREMETILEKATAKEPGDRYQSAQEFADDLARFLRDEPIHARPPTRWDKGVKWTRRHKSLAVGALIVLFVAAAGFLTSTILIAREQKHTQANFEEARQAVGFFAEVAEEQMNAPMLAGVRRTLLEQALVYYSTFLKEHADDPSARAEIVAAQGQVTAILQELAASQDAERVSQQISLMHERSVQEDPEMVMSSQQIDAADELFRNSFDPGLLGRGSQQTETSEQRRADFSRYADTNGKALRDILTAKQYDRLMQIERQTAGPQAFKNDEVAKKLGLSDEQRAAIERILEQMFMAHGPGGHGGPGGPHGPGGGGPEGPDGAKPDGGPGAMDFGGPDSSGNADSPWMKQVEGVLTPAQLSTWKEMIGKSFTGRIGRFPFGGGQRGRPGGFGPH